MKKILISALLIGFSVCAGQTSPTYEDLLAKIENSTAENFEKNLTALRNRVFGSQSTFEKNPEMVRMLLETVVRLDVDSGNGREGAQIDLLNFVYGADYPGFADDLAGLIDRVHDPAKELITSILSWKKSPEAVRVVFTLMDRNPP